MYDEMNDKIGYGDGHGSEADPSLARRFVPMQVGDAVVYIEENKGDLKVERSDKIYPASAGTEAVFDEATRIIKECVRVVGTQVTDLGEKVKPTRVEVEFSLSFEASGKAQVIPVILTGETKGGAGLRVTAVWGE